MSAQTVVVGAGPAGLAVAAMLGQYGASYTILEKADFVGAAWRDRYDGLRLHTVRWLSAWPGAPIPRRYGPWVRRDDLVAYLEQYAHQFQIRPEFGVEVTRIEREAAKWRLETSAGNREADTVVVTTGCSYTPYVPDWAGRESFAGSLRHSRDYREPSNYRNRRVLVVGQATRRRRSPSRWLELLPRSGCPYGPRPTLSGATSSACPARLWASRFGAYLKP